MDRHYTREELELYRHRQLSVLGRITCASHLKSCPECMALLEELKEEDLLIQKLRDSLKTFDKLAEAVPFHTGCSTPQTKQKSRHPSQL